MPSEELSSVSLAGKRILIVEDEGLIQMQLRKALLQAGLEVVGSAANGKEGVALALQEKPDIILMDVNMPVMNGLEATRHILTQETPCIVVLTAYVQEEYRQAAQEAGAHGYLTKPVDSTSLLPELARIYEAMCTPEETEKEAEDDTAQTSK